MYDCFCASADAAEVCVYAYSSLAAGIFLYEVLGSHARQEERWISSSEIVYEKEVCDFELLVNLKTGDYAGHGEVVS